MAEIQDFLSPKAEKQVAKLIKDMATLAKGYAKMATESKKVDDQLKKNSKNTAQTTEKEKQLNAIRKERVRITNATLAANAKLTQISQKGNKALLQKAELLKRQNEALKITTALENKEIGTLERLALQNRKLTNERKKLNLETATGKKRLIAINSELDKNNKKITKNADAFTKQKRGIGGYTDAINKASPAMGAFGGQLSSMSMQLGAMQGALRAMVPAMNSNTSALKKFRIALIATGIGAIVVVLGSLIAAFASTQAGVDAINSVLRPLSTLFGKLLGVIQKVSISGFGKLKEAIKNPIDALRNLGNMIKDNIINRFKSFQVFGEAIALLLDGKFAAAAKKAGDGFIQFGTGVTDGTDKLMNAGKQIGDFIGESIDQGQQLDELIKRFESRQVELELPIAKARLEYEKFRAIAQDQEKTDLNRIDALNEAEKQQQFIIKSEKELIGLKVQRMTLEQSFNDTSREELLELEKLKTEAFQVETKGQKKINTLISLRSGIEKRMTTANKKAAEEEAKAAEETNHNILTGKAILENEINKLKVDGLDERNDIIKTNEQKLVDDLFEINELARDREKEAKDKAAAEELAAIINKNKDIETLVMAGVQILTDVLRNFTDLRLRQISDEMNADNVRRQSDLAAIEGDKNKEAQINAKYDRKQAILRQKQWREEKKAALTQVTINTALAVVKSIGIFGSPPSPPGIAAIIASAAIGAIQTGIILAQKPPQFAEGSKGLSKDTYGEVGEAGRELVMFPSGDVGMATKSTKLAMPKGTVIKSNRDTEQILAANQVKAQRENDVILRDYSELKMLSESIKDDRKAILKAVKDQNQYSFNVSVKGVQAMMKNNKGTTTYLDNRFR